MGQKMVAIFEAIAKEDGVRGQMRLAMMTGITSAAANDIPDAQDKLVKFVAAYKEITQKECPIRI